MKPALFFRVEPADARQRLDVFLSGRESALSRSQVKRLIEQGQVKVGGQKAKAGLRLKTGDEVSLVLPEPQEPDVRAEPLPLSILYEDPHLLVINKPAGMVVHPGAGNPSGTLVNALLHHCRDWGGIGGVLRPGIVHRLDKDTSGLLVAAKSDAAHRGLSEQFKKHTAARKYMGIVFGRLPEEGRVDAQIGRHPVHRQKMTTRPRRGREARTRWKVVERFRDFSLAEFRLETGRTHQIRVHLSSVGHPLLGDPTYGGRRGLAAVEPAPLRQGLQKFPRQALHAATLGFTHPASGKELEFSAPLPEDMEAALALLRKWGR
jgi:23S rRNA pseudouridine1911/1915/1917 synthase